MTRQEFLDGTPFTFPSGDELPLEGINVYKYSEADSSELLLLVYGVWRYCTPVIAIGEKAFTVACVRINCIPKRLYQTPYAYLTPFVEVL